jgi:TrmH family RNA methyltransferase
LLDARGRSITCEAFKEFDCYMFGSEAEGASSEMLQLADTAVFSVPGQPLVESLNLAAAVNMSTYELFRH